MEQRSSLRVKSNNYSWKVIFLKFRQVELEIALDRPSLAENKKEFSKERMNSNS